MSEFISKVSSNDFETEVIKKSHSTPVLVDFWADWCQPCKQLMPLLDKIVESYNGTLHLAKVDTDQEQELAMSFGVRSLPTVLLFKEGQVVEQFLGVQPESEIRKLIDPHLSTVVVNEESGDNNLQQAIDLINSGDTLEAIDLLKNETNLDGKLMLVKVLLAEGEIDKAIELFSSFSNEEKDDKASLQIKITLDLINLGQESNDNELQEAISHTISVNPEQGVEKLLLLLTKSKNDESAPIKKALIRSFELFDNPKLVSQLRRKMAAIIF